MSVKLLFRDPTTGLLTQTDRNIVAEIGEIESNNFKLNGSAIVMANGTLSDGSGPAVDAINFQNAYDNSDVAGNADIIATTKKVRILSDNGSKYLIYDPVTGDLSVSGNLTVAGTTSVVDNVVTNYDTISISPSLPGTTALIIAPDSGVVPISPLVSIKNLSGGPDVFSILADGTAVLKDVSIAGSVTITGSINNIDIDTIRTQLTNHLTVSNNKHIAAEINVQPGTYSTSGVTQVQQAIVDLDGRITSNVASISTLTTRVTNIENTIGSSSGTLASGYEHTQSVASDSWTVTHNKNNSRATVQIYDAGNSLIQPNGIILGANSATISFAVPQSGFARFIFF